MATVVWQQLGEGDKEEPGELTDVTGVNGRHQQRPAGSRRGPGSRGILAEEEKVYTSQRNEERRLT